MLSIPVPTRGPSPTQLGSRSRCPCVVVPSFVHTHHTPCNGSLSPRYPIFPPSFIPPPLTPPVPSLHTSQKINPPTNQPIAMVMRSSLRAFIIG